MDILARKWVKAKKETKIFFLCPFRGPKIKYLENFKFCCNFSFMLKDGICNPKNIKVPVIFQNENFAARAAKFADFLELNS